MSTVEIYMEKIRDLLQIDNENLRLRESPTKGVFLEGVTERYIGVEDELYDYIQYAADNR